ncbi:hypothetical protein [Candidatus Spongiihabitans sp.]|uniref:hypothetical protein n=1 Tax=Candidatus Spongiihabitans sp. TaxID=3101308 RepID=UPI003C6F4947
MTSCSSTGLGCGSGNDSSKTASGFVADEETWGEETGSVEQLTTVRHTKLKTNIRGLNVRPNVLGSEHDTFHGLRSNNLAGNLDGHAIFNDRILSRSFLHKPIVIILQ